MTIAWLRSRVKPSASFLHVADLCRDMIWEAKQHGFELPRPKVRALLFDAAEAEGYARNHDDIYCDFLPIE